MNEASILAAIAEILGGPPPPAGIGDDAALLPRLSQNPILTVDAAVEGVHFTRELLDLEDVGFRATMAAASDVAAMGGSPRAILAALTAPRETTLDDFRALARGQRAAADMLGTTVVGGNLSRGPCLSLTTTVVGETSHALPRSGARIGDRVGVVGALGLAAAGLGLLLRAGARARAADRTNHPDTYGCLEAFRRPRALVEAGLALAGVATAALDVSDGLAIDGERLATASGVRLVLDAGALARLGGAPLAHAAAALDTTPLALALHGGEDYALLFTAPRLPPFSSWLGDVTDGPAGLVVLDEAGEPLPLPAGFAHFD